MLYLTLVLGVLIAMCVALKISGAWTQPNIGTVVLGVVCAVIGALMEARRAEQAKTVTENQRQLFMLPARDRSRITQAGWLSMLLAASYFVLGLILLMFQALAFFSS
jgi:hypothetical protein